MADGPEGPDGTDDADGADVSDGADEAEGAPQQAIGCEGPPAVGGAGDATVDGAAPDPEGATVDGAAPEAEGATVGPDPLPHAVATMTRHAATPASRLTAPRE